MAELAIEPVETVFHLIPNKDGFDHEDSSDCMCAPKVSFQYPGADEQLPLGTILYIHYGLDGRSFSYLPD